MVVAVSAVVLRDFESAIYAAITIFITSKLLDLILYGKDEAKLLIIISDRYETISGELLNRLDAGVTFVDGEGAYTGDRKKIIICAIKNSNLHKAKRIVKEADERAFMIVSSATEIYGEGYK